jgi:hypothetical protein
MHRRVKNNTYDLYAFFLALNNDFCDVDVSERVFDVTVRRIPRTKASNALLLC